jgi:hypothetical protein
LSVRKEMWVWKFRMENNDWFLWLILKVFQLQSGFFRGEWFLDRLICWNCLKWKTINFLNQIFYSIFLIELCTLMSKAKIEKIKILMGFHGGLQVVSCSREFCRFFQYSMFEKESISLFPVDPSFQCKHLT